MLKVVADTNVYISAILFGGKPERLRVLARERRITLLVSEDILAEIALILKRKFDWPDTQIDYTLEGLRAITTLTTPREQLNIIADHEPDNRFLECAVEGKADFIVSGDKRHLLPVKEFRGIRIITVGAFLDLIEE